MVDWNTKYDEMSDGKVFIGKITSCEDEEGDYGEQTHIQIAPLDHEIQGETGTYHEWLSPSRSKNSKFAQFKKALEDAGVEIKNGNKDLIGVTGEWEQAELVFENFKDGEDKIVKVLLLKQLTDEAGNPIGGKKKVTKTSTGKADFTALIEILKEKDADGDPVGMTKAKILKWARKNGIPQPELNDFLETLEGLKEEDGEYYIE